jgi:hypothetical protein
MMRFFALAAVVGSAIPAISHATALVFGPAQTVTASADAVWSIVAADVDRDGDLDVLSASQQGAAVTWYENRSGQAEITSTPANPAYPYPRSSTRSCSRSTAARRLR